MLRFANTNTVKSALRRSRISGVRGGLGQLCHFSSSSTGVLSGREELIEAKRMTIKLGSQIVTRSNGSGIAFGRLFNVVEQLAQLKATGREIVLVSSGAVAAGRHRLRHLIPGIEWPLPIPSRPLPKPGDSESGVITDGGVPSFDKGLLTMTACSASGQSGLMAIYEWMFAQYNIDCAQVLISQTDLANEDSRSNVLGLINDLLHAGLLPIINENDAIPRQPTEFQPGTILRL